MIWQQGQQREHQGGQEAGAQAWEGRLEEPGLLQPEEEQSQRYLTAAHSYLQGCHQEHGDQALHSTGEIQRL